MFDNQSQSRLMTLPKELRNRIFEFVFYDDAQYVDEPVAYKLVRNVEGHQSPAGIQYVIVAKAEMAHVPRSIHFDHITAPSKDYILLCRTLYSEMKQMYIAAYRSYWTTNRFTFSTKMSEKCKSSLPVDEDMARIQEFHVVLHRKCYLRIAFDGLKWDLWLLPVDGKIQMVTHLVPTWYITRGDLEDAVNNYLLTMASSGFGTDPRAGQGLTRDMIVTISHLVGLDQGLQRLLDKDDV